jgi:hypothetical protein
MPLTTWGAAALWLGAVGAVDAQLSHANALLVVGDGTAAESVANDLMGVGGTAAPEAKSLDAGYPTAPGGWLVTTYQTTFDPTEANFHWKEWGLTSITDPTRMIVRKVEDQGTKQAGQTWVLRVTITAAAGT